MIKERINDFLVELEVPKVNDYTILSLNCDDKKINVYILPNENKYVINLDGEDKYVEKYQSEDELYELKLKDLTIDDIIKDILEVLYTDEIVDGGLSQDIINYKKFLSEISNDEKLYIKKNWLSR